MSSSREPSSGVTLIEVLTALMIFAVIGAASMTVLKQVSTAAEAVFLRAHRLEEINRAFRLMELDFSLMNQGSLSVADGKISLQRDMSNGEEVTVSYVLEDATFLRRLSITSKKTDQMIMSSVESLNLTFFYSEIGWSTDGTISEQASGLKLSFILRDPRESVLRALLLNPKIRP